MYNGSKEKKDKEPGLVVAAALSHSSHIYNSILLVILRAVVHLPLRSVAGLASA